jgi:tetrahydromethanopterin S-methyltransferase subunit G
MCGGMGFNGDARLYMESEAKKEWDSNQEKVSFMMSETSQRFQRIEDEFYKVVKKTEALEKAVQAMENYIKERK